MTTVPQIKKPGGDKCWLVKNEQGETFGPVDFETLKLWAKDGRLAPHEYAFRRLDNLERGHPLS
jgi:hypothetical protein